MSNKGQLLQDPFLNALRREHVPVSIYLVNGITLLYPEHRRAPQGPRQAPAERSARVAAPRAREPPFLRGSLVKKIFSATDIWGIKLFS